jgi:pimeloyl-ACP methyl ester carboxylesterase
MGHRFSVVAGGVDLAAQRWAGEGPRVVLLQGTAHLPYLERPAEVAQVVRAAVG